MSSDSLNSAPLLEDQAAHEDMQISCRRQLAIHEMGDYPGQVVSGNAPNGVGWAAERPVDAVHGLEGDNDALLLSGGEARQTQQT